MKTIISLVGTSLKNNFNRENIGKRPTPEALAHFAKSDRKTSSAEMNTLDRLHLHDEDNVVLLHSDTEDGRLCGASLKTALGKNCSMVQISKLDYDHKTFKKGLRNLVDTLIDQIEKAQKDGRSVVIAATGGFKAESSYCTLVGLLFGVPVVYLHEKFGGVVELPTLPIAWDIDFVIDHEDFLLWLDSDAREKDEVDRRLNGFLEEVKKKLDTLVYEEDGYILLNAAGVAMLRLLQHKSEQAKSNTLRITLEAKKAISGSMALKEIVEKLRMPERRKRAERKQPHDVYAYPQGHVKERVIFFNEEVPVIVGAFVDHDDYERGLAKAPTKADLPNLELEDY